MATIGYNGVNAPEILTTAEKRLRFYSHVTQIQKAPDGKLPLLLTAKQLADLKIGEDLFLVENLIPKNSLTVLVGAPGVGKSLFAKQLCILLANGASGFLGFALKTEHKRALYLSTEDGHVVMRLTSIKQHKGLGYPNSPSLDLLFPGELTVKELLILIDIHLEHYPVDLVVIDGFGDLFSGSDMNSNAEVRASLQPLYRLAQDRKCSILLLHHLTKAAYSQAASQEHVQGAASLVQKSRSVICLKNIKGGKLLQILKSNGVSESVKRKKFHLDLQENYLIFSLIKEVCIDDVSSPSIIAPSSRTLKDNTTESIKTILGSKIDSKGMAPEDVIAIIQQIQEQSPTTARRMLSALKGTKFLRKHTGLYVLGSTITKSTETEKDTTL